MTAVGVGAFPPQAAGPTDPSGSVGVLSPRAVGAHPARAGARARADIPGKAGGSRT